MVDKWDAISNDPLECAYYLAAGARLRGVIHSEKETVFDLVDVPQSAKKGWASGKGQIEIGALRKAIAEISLEMLFGKILSDFLG